MTIAPSQEVRAALAEGRALVALETSVLAQGLPTSRAPGAAEAMDAAAREAGAVPAWTWIEAGRVRIGASARDLERLCREPAAKVGRADLPTTVAEGGLGATTVSATLWIAHRTGIEVAATGGIGGVHPGGGDVSADLVELARTPATLVCSGPKSILDPLATLERLEELGVGILGYGCDRLPFFVVREVDLPLEHRAETPEEAAAVAGARRSLGVGAALLVCVPVPEDRAMPASEVADALDRCRARAEARGVRGKDVTPFLLGCLGEETGGRSVESNLALLSSNVRVAAAIAARLS